MHQCPSLSKYAIILQSIFWPILSIHYLRILKNNAFIISVSTVLAEDA
jgi:hypothetical protein